LRRLLSLLAILAIASPAAAAPPPGGEATAEGITAANDHYQPASTIRPPFYQRWTLSLGVHVSQPLIADGRAYFGVPYVPGRLMAVDITTGATDWSVNTEVLHLAYDERKIFVTSTTALSAFDATNGTLLWSVPAATQSAPIATAGVVYLYYAYGWKLTAVDEVTGAIIWSTPVAGGVSSGAVPAVSTANVFAGDGCGHATSLDLLGNVVWSPTGNCTSSGDVAFGNDRIVTQAGTILDAATGARLGSFASTAGVAAVVGDTIVAQASDRVSSLVASSGKTTWTRQSGDSSTAPIVAGSVVVASSSSWATPWRLLFIDLATGKLLDSLAGPIGQVDFGAVTVAAGEGVLLVNSGASLTAYDATFRRVPRRVQANAFTPAANSSWEAWSVYIGSHVPVRGYYEARSSAVPIRIDTGSSGIYMGNIDGNRIVYQRLMSDGARDAIAYLVAGQTRHTTFGRFVNDGAWLWQPTLSGNWLLYNHGENAKTHSVMLANLKKRRVKTLAKGNPKKLWVGAGQVAGNYAVWAQCRKGHWCVVERRTLSSGHTVTLRAPGMDLSNPAVTPAGVVYALAAGRESSCPTEYMARWKPGALEDLYTIPANHLAFNLDAGMLTDGRVDVRYELDTCTRTGRPYENDEFVDRTDVPALTAAPFGAPRSVAAPGSRVPVTERSYAAPPGSVTTMRQPRG
jgi:outer membrane protein assembly factor BamB